MRGAVEALVARIPLDVEVDIDLPRRLPEPIESASYFAIAECLANTIKHSGATRAWVRGRSVEGRLSFMVGDNGRGGAVPSDNGGLRGIERRLEAFDSTMVVASASGGGTIVTFELPCGDLSPNAGA